MLLYWIENPKLVRPDCKSGLARNKDWKRFVKIIIDRKSMHDTWHDWHKDFERTKRDLTNQGFDVVDIVVDLDELTEYCRMRGIKNDRKTCSQLVQTK